MKNPSPLYDPRFEHDACGIGAVVDLTGRKTYATVDKALRIVEKLEHRAGKDAAGETGDGVGLLLQVPHRLCVKAAAGLGIALGGERDYGVGMFFFPTDHLKRAQAKKMLEIIMAKEGMEFLGWRDVPVRLEVLGERARACMPHISQCFVRRPADCSRGLDFDRKLYVARRVFEQSNVNTYIPSFSSRTIVYKGMFLVGQLRQFYADLTDPDCESAIALVHSRFSANTTPSWERAHPNRYILHNGEINTIRGNVDRMLAREEIVTDTTVYVGPSGNLLEEKAGNCTVLQIQNPILTDLDLMKIRYMDRPGFHVETVSLLYYKGSPPGERPGPPGGERGPGV